MEPKSTKPLPDCTEGPEASERFAAIVTKLLSVPRAVLMEREKVYRKQADANPKRRGPKRKSKIVTAQQELLSKLQDQKQAIDNKLVDVEQEILTRALGRRKRPLA